MEGGGQSNQQHFINQSMDSSLMTVDQNAQNSNDYLKDSILIGIPDSTSTSLSASGGAPLVYVFGQNSYGELGLGKYNLQT